MAIGSAQVLSTNIKGAVPKAMWAHKGNIAYYIISIHIYWTVLGNTLWTCRRGYTCGSQGCRVARCILGHLVGS